LPTSKEYWLKRTKEIVAKSETNEDAVVKEIGEIYQHATKQLEKDLQAFYGKYATETGLSIQQAKKKIKKADAKNFRAEIDYFVKNKHDLTDREIEQWRMLRTKFNITRLDLLINEMDAKLIDLYGKQDSTMRGKLKLIGKKVTKSVEKMFIDSDIVGDFTRLPDTEIEQIVNFPWSGAEFSDLLWGHKDQLVKSLRKNITIGLIRGDSVQDMARALRKEVGNSVYASERLIRTETNHVMNESTLKSYEDNGLTHYEFVANIDEKTSNVCKRHDGNIYKLSERRTGVNASPLHPNCRSYSVPVVD